jgi:tungstate transport system substrate-binding protein
MGLRKAFTAVAFSAVAAVACATAQAQQKFITVASTTSTDQSGLFKHLLPIYAQKAGVEVRVIAVGTGQALDMGRKGDADVVFVHDPVAEKKYMDDGWGVNYHLVMYNDFILVGPKADPAKVGGKDVLGGLQKVKVAQAPFVSRADKSGTHAAEVRLWSLAGVDIAKDKGPWYKETGSGMGPALNTASAMGGYILADRGTWLNFKNRADLAILVEGDNKLFNQYGIMLVNPAKHPHVKKDLGDAFIAWVISSEGQKAIADYKIGGEQLFFPNAK